MVIRLRHIFVIFLVDFVYMKKYLHIVLLVLVFSWSCEDQSQNKENCNFSPSLYSSLPYNNGAYELELDQSSIQTFTTIFLDIGSEVVKKVEFASDVVVQVGSQWFDLVNTTSYTRSDGTTQTTLGVFEQNVGEIINIYCGFYDDCGNHYTDQIIIRVVNNF